MLMSEYLYEKEQASTNATYVNFFVCNFNPMSTWTPPHTYTVLNTSLCTVLNTVLYCTLYSTSLYTKRYLDTLVHMQFMF